MYGRVHLDSGLNFVAVGAASSILVAPRAGDEVGGYLIDLAKFSGSRKKRCQPIYQHEFGITADAVSGMATWLWAYLTFQGGGRLITGGGL
jgi:hypothetical protein